MLLLHAIIGSIAVGGVNTLISTHKLSDSELAYYRGKYDREIPQWVILGNSISKSNIDMETLGNELGKKVAMFRRDGSHSALWYIAMANVFAKVKKKPEVFILPFRETDLTDPLYGLSGFRETDLIALSEKDEPLLKEKVWEPSMGKLGNFLFQNIPFIHSRQEIKSMIYPKTKNIAVGLFGKNENFSRDINRIMNVLGKPADILNEKKRFGKGSFEEKLANSLLPDIVEIVKKYNINLVLIRVKKKSHIVEPESVEMRKYMADLRDYLESNGVVLLDYTELDDIHKEHFASGDHLNEEGKRIFTEHLIQDLRYLSL